MNERRLTYAEFEERVRRREGFFNATVTTPLPEAQARLVERLTAVAQSEPENHILIDWSDLKTCVDQYALDLQIIHRNSFDLLVRSVFEAED